MNDKRNDYEYSTQLRRDRSRRELTLKVDDLIHLLLAVGFAHLNLCFECGNVMRFHLESMGRAYNTDFLVTSVRQKSIVCLRAQKKLTDRCITNILSAPKG
jgi:hypothetical protein